MEKNTLINCFKGWAESLDMNGLDGRKEGAYGLREYFINGCGYHITEDMAMELYTIWEVYEYYENKCSNEYFFMVEVPINKLQIGFDCGWDAALVDFNIIRK